MLAIRHADRVAETWTGTGTGNITLASVAADTGFQTFADTGLASVYVHYCITNDAGDWEVGLGFLSGAGTSLTRNGSTARVLASSNAGAAVDWAAGDKRIELVNPAAFIDKRIWFSTSAPTVNDDYADGFVDGSIWVVEDPAASDNSLNWAYYMDSGTVGAAVWSPLGPWVGAGTNATASLRLASWLATWARIDLTGLNGFNAGAWNGSNALNCVALGDSANLQNRNSLAIGAGKTTGQTANGGHQGEVIVQAGQTTNATETALGYSSEQCFEMHENGAASFYIQVVGYEPATGDSFARDFHALVTRATGIAAIVAQSQTDIGAAAGAAAWEAALAISGVGNGDHGLIVTVTGEAAKTIEWTATAYRTSAHKAA
jgi:hypothetical protein